MLTRRQFLSAGLMAVIACCTCIQDLHAAPSRLSRRKKYLPFFSGKKPKTEPEAQSILTKAQENELVTLTDEEVKDYLFKMRNFDKPFPNDIILSAENAILLNSVMNKLTQIQRIVGHGKFYLISIDEAASLAKNSSIGNFSKKELLFLEELFYTDATKYGFMDTKPITKFTTKISHKDVYKVPGMGNYLYKGASQKKWGEIQKIVGKDVILTSGVRGVVKQLYLFLAKAQKFDANLSLASRSLAPAGYSFHGVGDFDVGQRGFGARNFTADFTATNVYKQLSVNGYLSLRYPKDNFLGVRFEPWHVKVVSS